jgi:FAD/FMN-containing dehydrogenase
MRTVFMGDIDRRPAAIVRAANANDVEHAIAFARDSGLELAVRGGGHSGAGHGVVDNGLVIDLRDMKAVEVDVDGRTAWAEAGLTAAELSAALGAHGLAVGFGDTGSVGIGGITLGGGIGYLTRKHGLTIDSLLAAEVATAGGDLLYTDAVSHPDLFWAIRGGGGNFGVVTRFHYRVHPVDRVLGGMLLMPATADVIAGLAAASDAAPEELSAIVNVMPAPPMPFVPAELHGTLVAMVLACYAGEPEAGERAFAAFRGVARPLADMVRPMRYPEMFPPLDDAYHPAAVARTMFMTRVDRETAETMLKFLPASGGPMRVVQFRVLGGAMARVATEATAFAHRASPILASIAAFYEGAADRAVQQAWVDECTRALDQGEPGLYVNFLGDEGESRVRAAYPGETWTRLAAIKARYDPGNLFRRNQNVPPAA